MLLLLLSLFCSDDVPEFLSSPFPPEMEVVTVVVTVVVMVTQRALLPIDVVPVGHRVQFRSVVGVGPWAG